MRKLSIVTLALATLAVFPVFGAKEESVADKVKNARNLIKKRQYAAAVEILTPVIAADPNNTQAAMERASANLALGNGKDALEDLNNVVKLAPNDAQGYALRARVYGAGDRLTDAVADTTRALEIKKDAEVLLYRASLYEGAKMYAKALADYDEVVKMQPVYTVHRINRARLRMLTGDGRGATQDFNFALQLNPNLREQVETARTNPAKATKTEVAKVSKPTLLPEAPKAETASDNPPQVAVRVMKDIKKRSSKAPETKPVETKVAEVKTPEPKPAETKVAETKVPEPVKKDPPPAPVEVAKATPPPVPTPAPAPVVTSAPSNTQLLGQARRLADAGKLDEAAAAFTELIAASPKMTEAHMRKCAVEFARKKFDVAIADCSKAIELNAKDSDAYYWRGRARVQGNALAAAVEDFSRSIEFKPFNPDAFYHRANAERTLDDLTGALFDFSEAVRQKQAYPEALEARAEIRKTLGDSRGYEEDMQRLGRKAN